MKALLLKYWERLRSSFWFLPAAMACLAVALAFAAVALDRAVTDDWLERLGWRYSGGAEGASLMLGTVAGSMIAIAGTVFSMTLVAMSLASSQLGPRLLRNFMRDTSNQVVLGTFVATFVYCLLVLRTIRRADEVAFVPQLSVSIGVLLALVSIGVLIYFIHHVSVSIQADVVVARVSRELDDGIGRMFPGHLGKSQSEAPNPPDAAELPAAFAHEARPAGALEDGYLQLIDADALMELAREQDLLLQLECRPGHYLVHGQTMVMVWPGDRMNDELVHQLNAAFVLGNQRTATEDIEFSFLQLVEIAVRALSPGINDPFTAIACVDRLGSALCRLARSDMPSPFRFDDLGQLRLVATGYTFAGITDTAFNQIRQNARSNPAVAIRMLDAIARIACHVRSASDAACLRRHADMIVRGAREAVPEAGDRLDVEARYMAAAQALRSFRVEPGDQTGNRFLA
ncbi:DUF2254 domain-containing protein [Methyloversatilis sp.]|uniref:DUF2254 domain-containing protein n=1 Tax=Methyloversatilis sp. TaxID=2569862 RepID=UPI00273623D3|nr:DUF2254 domain-containing protein [Methyloversatilis sp.]MDP2867398.1 DUF2254 domain-containing protein [Methyloversatilis sp.]MDP3456848.1 DUF2254 domain-containing protein [Methyloversatilis sp.]MDP3580142.1 DUF2254 domain-containing protein [Methyloversatilis sp.]